MTLLANKRIILGITGGIAAYKSAALIRELCNAGCIVKAVVTESAKAFVTPLTLQALSGNEVRDDLFDASAEKAMNHIELARWAELIIIAPATADFIARLAYGFADQLLSTLCLASHAPLIIAPAMNQQMWHHPATEHNIAILMQRGVTILGPDEGYQACGEYGPGRMVEPETIVNAISAHVPTGLLKQQRVIITAGPTQEAIDPVRYISNHSSGKMGYAIAKAALNEGAEVILISGPTQLPHDSNIKRINVTTAQEMYHAVLKHMTAATIYISAAAIADFRCEEVASQKLKKTNNNLNTTMTLKLVANPDILATVANLTPRPLLVVGFAAETENIIEHARSKLAAKNLDMIIANQVGNPQAGFNSDYNSVEIITKDLHVTLPKATKNHIAHQIIHIISQQLKDKIHDH